MPPRNDYTKNQIRYRIIEPPKGVPYRTIPIGKHHSGIVRVKTDGWHTQSVRIGRHETLETKRKLRKMVRQLRKRGKG